MSETARFLAESRLALDAALETWAVAVEQDPGGAVGSAMAYSLRGAGKRLRPALLVAAYRAAGGRADPLTLGVAVEIVHTYSLVHDDLPCMDDDDLRRGRATTHRVHGVAAATEAGFHMVRLAARVLRDGAERLGLDETVRRRLAVTLFRAAGPDGMIGGQVLDLEAEDRAADLAALTRIHRAKTGALITASAVIGAVAAGAPEPVCVAVGAYAEELGLAFQIVDDVLDTTGSTAALGKTAGKDARQRKASFATLLGVEAARQEAARRVARAMAHLGAGGIDSTVLAGIARFVLDRPS